MTSLHINSQRAPEPVGPYPHARRVGNLLFLSGVGPRKRSEKSIPGVQLDAQGQIASYDIESSVVWFLKTSASSWKRPAPTGTIWWTSPCS